MKEETLNLKAVETPKFRQLELKKKFRISESVIQALLFFAGVLVHFHHHRHCLRIGQGSHALLHQSRCDAGKIPRHNKVAAGDWTVWDLGAGDSATLVTSFIAIFVSLPLGLAAALFT